MTEQLQGQSQSPQTYIFLALAIIAFAFNSVLCRMALSAEAIDPASFTIIRLVSGTIMLMLLLLLRQKRMSLLIHKSLSKGSWAGAVALFIYALGFSFAYVKIDSGVGALILFGSVQVSMIAVGLVKGERFNALQSLGLFASIVGLLYLLWPSLSSPSALGAMAMLIAGLAWGVYSLLGKGSADALADTAYNFLRCTPFIILLLPITYTSYKLTETGVVLAILSGALASGLGYAIWYKVLPFFTSMSASVAQLSVPILAALGGLLLIGEAIGPRLIIASVFVLGGVFIVLRFKPAKITK